MAYETIQEQIDRIKEGKESLRTYINEKTQFRTSDLGANYTLTDTIYGMTRYMYQVEAATNDVYYATNNYVTSLTAKNTNIFTDYDYKITTTLTSTVTSAGTVGGKTLYYFYGWKIPTTSQKYGLYFQNGTKLQYNKLYCLGTSDIIYRTSSTTYTTYTNSTPIYGLLTKKKTTSESGVYSSETVFYLCTTSSSITIIKGSTTSNMKYGGFSFTQPIVMVGNSFSTPTLKGGYSSSTASSLYVIGSSSIKELTSVSTYPGSDTPYTLPTQLSDSTISVLAGINYIYADTNTTGTFLTTDLLKTTTLTRANRVLIGDANRGFYEYYVPSSITTLSSWLSYAAGGIVYPIASSEIGSSTGGCTDYYLKLTGSDYYQMCLQNAASTGSFTLKRADTGAAWQTSSSAIEDELILCDTNVPIVTIGG